MNKDECLNKLIQVKKLADNKIELISNQGQAMDGYSELANYRSILQEYMDEIEKHST